MGARYTIEGQRERGVGSTSSWEMEKVYTKKAPRTNWILSRERAF